MNTLRCMGLVAAVLAAAQSGPALACGDKLSMMGGGVSFERINASAHRGSVVMLLAPDSQLRATAADLELKRSLERAGHTVRTLATTDELAAQLRNGGVDVVLVDAWVAENMRRQIAAAAPATSKPIVLTVIYKPGAGGQPTTQVERLCVARADKQNGRAVLNAIEQELARKARGEPVACGSLPPVQST
jgi:vacuolar-type H+-ATPase subunit F/Vma7